MLKKIIIITVLVTFLIVSSLITCPVCVDSNSRHAEYFRNNFINNNNRANNPRVEKIKQILETMKNNNE